MSKNVQRVTLLIATLGLSGTLFATLDSQKDFVAKYPDAKAKLGKCTTCHTAALPKKDKKETLELNAYGKELEKVVLDAKAAKKQYDYAKAEGADSDGDGTKNIDEIKAGTNPGAK